jgi:glycosyltransferase involved in cell wall biosynthesis
MRIAIIGPAHPYKGGIAQHTTELAHRLSGAGNEVDIISWRTQYPFFYPGQQFVDEPELPEHGGTKRVLSWRNPAGWAKWGRRLRSYDRIIFVWWVPTIQGPVYWGMLKALGRKRPPATIICHNVLPHEPRPGDKKLARAVLKKCEQVIVHSQAQAKLAKELSGKPPTVLNLPLPLLKSVKKHPQGVSRELLFFGFVRPYKGVDVLLRALAQVPDVKLTIVGEIWGTRKTYTNLIQDLHIGDRVVLKGGYVPMNQLAELIAQADAVVLPYKEGTGTWNVSMAHAYGTPVIATKVGSMASQIRHGVDGILCEPDNIEALQKALESFYQPGTPEKLRQNVPAISADNDWNRYVLAVTRG